MRDFGARLLGATLVRDTPANACPQVKQAFACTEAVGRVSCRRASKSKAGSQNHNLYPSSHSTDFNVQEESTDITQVGEEKGEASNR